MEETKHKKTDFFGKKAMIIGKGHPHYNATAICMGAGNTDIGWGMKFKNINTNEEFYVFDGEEVMFLN